MTTTTSSTLERTIEESGLVPTSATALQQAFEPIFEKARDLVAKSAGIVVTDATQVTAMKDARVHRLALKDVRVACNKLREELKRDSLNYGKAVQGVYNLIAGIIEPEEARLEEAEKFAERAEAARQEATRKARAEALAPFCANVTIYPLGTMTDAAFAELLGGLQAAHEKRIADAKKAEEDRISREKAEAEERARIKDENDRLRAEAEAREAAAKAEREKAAKELAESQAKARREREEAEEAARKERLRLQALADIERQKAEAALKAEREAREAAEAKVRAEAAAKAKAEADAAKAAKRAASAPDADKLRSLADSFRQIVMPRLVSPEAQALGLQIMNWRELLAGRIIEGAEKLGGAA